MFSYEEFLSFLVLVTWFFYIWKVLEFLHFCTKSSANLFLESFVQKVFIHFSRRPFFIFLQSPMKKTLWVKQTVLFAKMTWCKLFYISKILFYCWFTLKSCYINCTHYSLHINNCIVSTHNSSFDSMRKLLARLFNSLEMCIGQFTSTSKTQKERQSAWHCKEETPEKTMYFFGLFGKTKSTQPSGTVFANRIEPAKKNKIDLELLKIENCKFFCEW